ncbi:TPA: hypothetical protein ACIVCU_004530, partial [Salmonella enterica subsp. enterica serovar Wangata]
KKYSIGLGGGRDSLSLKKAGKVIKSSRLFYYQLLINSCSVLLRLITGISPVLFSAPGNVFTHCSTFRLLIRATLI